MATTAYGCLLPQLDQKFEKEKEKTIASQEFSYFTDMYIRNTPVNDAWMGIGAISIQHPKKGNGQYTCLYDCVKGGIVSK